MIQLSQPLQAPKGSTGSPYQLSPGSDFRALGMPGQQQMPQNRFSLPGGQASPFAGFNDALWRDTQARTEREGRRATIQEYKQAGGDPNEYYKIYGGPASGAYEQLQQQYESGGGRIPLEAYRAAGFNPNDYYKLYGDPQPEQTAQGQLAPIFDAQRQANYVQAGIDSQMNRINEFNPYGSSQYITNPDGSVSRISNLSNENQNLLNQQQFQDAQRGELISNLIGGQGQSLLGGGSAADRAAQAEQQVYDRYVSDLDRRFGQEADQLRTQLLNAGVPQNSERYNKAMLDFEKRKQDAYAGARTYAMEQGRAQGQFLNDNRNQIINEIAGLQGQQRGVINPSFSQNYNVQMPYIDQSTPLAQGYLDSRQLQQQQQYDQQKRTQDYEYERQMMERKAQLDQELARIARSGRGGGGGGDTNAFEAQLLQWALQSGNQQNQPNPFLTGIGAGLGQGAGAAIAGLF